MIIHLLIYKIEKNININFIRNKMELLLFKEVRFKHLKKGTKYIIKRINEHEIIQFIYTGKFTGYFHKLENVSMFDEIKEIMGIKKINSHKVNFFNEYNITYYSLDGKKEKIQEAMELRAIKKVLCKITGDESFVY